MQKKIIALAVAAAMATPALALAEVSMSGQVNMSIDMNNDGAVTNSGSTNHLTSNQSRLQFKGSEDLGGGLSAIWQLDSRFNVDTGTISGSTLFGGNNYLGVKSNDMGTLMVGKIDSPYKSATRNLDVFFDVAGDNRAKVGSIGGLLTNDIRLDNALAYMSPSMSGFSVSAATVFGAESATGGQTKGSAYALAGMYSMNGIYATLAYQTAKAGSSGSGDLGVCASTASCLFSGGAVDDEAKALKLGGGYTMDAITVNAVFEQPKYTSGANEAKNTNFYLGAKFAISGTDSVRAAYTARGETKINGTGANDKESQIAVGYAHDMSKTTSVYATYVKTTNDATGGADPSSVSFGMKHSF